MALLNLLESNALVLLASALLLGLIVGSFLNVVIHRLPLMMQRAWAAEAAAANGEAVTESEPFDLVRPASRCPHCGHAIRAWENIPLLSYLLLGGRCSECRAGISARYPLVELLAGLLALATAWHFGASLETAALLLFFWALLALTVIDLDHQLLPDDLTLPLLWLGLLLNLNSVFVPLPQAVTGAVAGYLSLWSIYWLFKLVTGKEGMGHGDFKLFAAFGAWFGWAALPLIILLSSLVGALVGITLIAILGRDRQIPIPFGPYLCGAALVYVFWGEAITTWYLGSLA